MRQPPKESSQSLSYHIALGGIIAALCIACMFLTGVFPMFYLILPMLAMQSAAMIPPRAI